MVTNNINFCSSNSSNTKNVNKTTRNFTPHLADSNKQTELNTENKGVIRGFLAAQVVNSLISIPLGTVILSKIMKTDSISVEENATIAKAADEILVNAGLKDKGVEIVRLTQADKNTPIEFTEQDKALMQEITDKIKHHPLMKFFNKIFAGESEFKKSCSTSFNKGVNEGVINQFIAPAKYGQNALFAPQVNKVIIPDKSHQTVIFHELGHAMDANGGIITKTLSKIRTKGNIITTLVPAAILLTSLLNRRKVTDKTSKNDTKKQKAMDFVKRNAGKLTAFTLGICYAEEGIASIRSAKAAKELVGKGKITNDLLKRINKGNTLGFATYALATAASAIGIKAGIALKDKIQEKYEEKQNLKTTQS